MTKYAMALEAEANGSHYVDQIFLIQFLLKIIDKIKTDLTDSCGSNVIELLKI